MELKSFEISVELAGKLKVVIVEWSKGRSSWIWCGNKSLGRLLEGVEESCRDGRVGNVFKEWEEEGGSYRLQIRSNAARRLLLCLVVDVGAKRFCIIFPEGRDLLGGWPTLATKLRLLGVIVRNNSSNRSFEVSSAPESSSGRERQENPLSFLEVAKLENRRIGDAL